MSYYYLILVWVAVAYFISSTVKVQKIEYVCGKRVSRYTYIWAVIIFLPLVIWCGYRGWIFDTGAYISAYKNMPLVFSEIPEYMKDVTKDEGFYYLSAVLKTFIGENYHIYFIVIASIQAVCLMSVYRKYSINYIVTFFLFIASTDYISWMFNGIRQFCAVVITFACFPLILKRKYIIAAIFIALASLLHGSALLVLPFMFIVQGKPWNKKTLMFIAGIIVCIAFVERFTNILDGMLAETQYKNVVSDWTSSSDNGTSLLRVCVYSVPTLLSLFGSRYIHRENDPVINLCVNMSVVSMGFYVISIFTSGIFIGRIPIYFSLYNYILLPWEIEHFFNRRSRQFVYLIMICAYLFFYFYQVKLGWGLV